MIPVGYFPAGDIDIILEPEEFGNDWQPIET